MAAPEAGHAADEPSFQAIQRTLAAYVRAPATASPPAGVDAGRLRVYVDICHTNIEGFLARTFHVAKSVTPAAHWHAMARDFYQRHRCESPYFHDIPKAFLDYLEERDVAADAPFLRELCHFEWVGRMLDRLDVALPPPTPPPAALLDGHFTVSPLARVFCYRFPVHTIGPEVQPTAPPPAPTWLIVFRDRAERVDVMASNAPTARLVERIDAGDSLRQALAAVAQELGRELEGMLGFGESIARRLVERDILLPA